MASKRKKAEPQVKKLPEAREYPWHREPWAILTTQLQRLPHAMLLQGQQGLGKTGFAMRLAQSLLCQSRGSDAAACGQCKSCQLFVAGSHPDLSFIDPEETGKAITVDQTRALANYLYLKPHMGSHKITIIAPAENMNIHAANSLLKMLEEPPLGNIMILVSSLPGKLPVTIRSRCLPIKFAAPDNTTGRAWLVAEGVAVEQAEQALIYSSGAPLTALALAKSDFLGRSLDWLRDIATLYSTRKGSASDVAAKWKKEGSAETLLWLQETVQDMIRRANGLGPMLPAADEKAEQWLQDTIKQLNLTKLFGFLDSISEARTLLSTPLDEQLLLESLLIKWRNLADNK
ncbi:MAG: DNA polymerase III subunit delta' [Proteobacteria bacterium]|nr:DNA polymerase III subunit delta' [Pseudomonadota bacterium]